MFWWWGKAFKCREPSRYQSNKQQETPQCVICFYTETWKLPHLHTLQSITYLTPQLTTLSCRIYIHDLEQNGSSVLHQFCLSIAACLLCSYPHTCTKTVSTHLQLQSLLLPKRFEFLYQYLSCILLMWSQSRWCSVLSLEQTQHGN